MTNDILDPATRAAKGHKLYTLWLNSGQSFPPGNYTPWDKLDAAQQGRWIWLSKMLGEPKHDHYQPTPVDVVKYPEATTVMRAPEMWDYADPAAPYPASNKDAFYLIWVEQRQSQLRQHWWQLWRPTQVDTSRELFDKQLKAYLRNTSQPIADQ